MINNYDVAVIGAGLAGLTCAKILSNQSLEVIVLDKSRGVGGRLATRRLQNTIVDHGLPYLLNQGELSNNLIEELTQENILQPWPGEIYELNPDQSLTKTVAVNRYFASEGITSVAKYIAQNLTIKRQAKVIKISKNSDNNWSLTLENNSEIIQAKYVVCAIPAPQALMLIQDSPNLNLSPQIKDNLNSVSFHPRLVLMAGYNHENNLPPWQGLRINHKDLMFIILDSSKRHNNQESVFVIHSTPEFAQDYLDSDNLDLVAEKILDISSKLTAFPFNKPNWYQIHRWRYATVKNALNSRYLQDKNLFFCGDWCQGNLLENALVSGNLTGNKIIENLQNMP